MRISDKAHTKTHKGQVHDVMFCDETSDSCDLAGI